MIYNLICYVLIPLCFGRAISFLAKTDLAKLGINTLLGFITIPIIPFVLNLLFNVTLTTTALLTIVAAIPGLVLILKDVKEKKIEYLNHPFIFISIPVLISYHILSHSYDITSWDELSNWLTMPKQMFMFNTIYSKKFLLQSNVVYTPAWHYLCIFKDLIFSQHFNVATVLAMPLTLGILFLSIIYDTMTVAKLKWDISLIAIATLLLFKIPFLFYFKSLYVEPPMGIITIFIFILFYLALENPEKRKYYWLIGYTLGFAFVLKHSFMTLAPIVGLLAVTTKLITHKFSELKSKFIPHSIDILITVIPFIICYAIWEYHLTIDDIPKKLRPELKSWATLLSIVKARSAIFTAIPKEIIVLIKNYFISFAITITGLCIGIKNSKKYLTITLYAMGNVVFYFGCLIWSYLTIFGHYEAVRIASFSRYMSVPWFAVKLLGILTFIVFLIYKAKAIIDHKLGNQVKKLEKVLKPVLLVLILVHYSLYFKKSVFNKFEVIETAKSFEDIFKKFNLKTPKMLLIYQGGNNFEFHLAEYASITPTKYLYKVLYGTSYGEEKDNVWRTIVKKEQMLKKIQNEVDVVWVLKSDKWFDSILSKYLDPKSCPKPYKYLLINKDNKTHCVPFNMIKV